MAADFVHAHPIDVENVEGPDTLRLPTTYQPMYNRVNNYSLWQGYLLPIEYTSWRDETMAAQETCAMAINLNPCPWLSVEGPDALQFLKDNLVNKLDKFPIGSSKHGVMCLDNGNVAGSGVLMRTGEESYEVTCLSPALNLRFEQKDYDAKIEDLTNTLFTFQLIGPKSLEIVEDACQEDFHDLKLCRFRESTMCGKKVRVLRFGMTGGLAYEVHGVVEDAPLIHQRLCEVGNKYGLRLMGYESYMLSHTPGGSQQFYIHYMPDLPQECLDMYMSLDSSDEPDSIITGSASEHPEEFYMNPFELSLDYVCDFNRPFRGRDALLEYKKDPKRKMVTLKWNPEDLVDIYASQFEEGEPYKQIDYPGQSYCINHGEESSFDYVLDADGNKIGISTGRTLAPWHKAMLSLASIDLAFTELGTEVYVLWGDPGTRQKKVRATVERMPYNQNYSNRTFDVEQIPHLSEREPC